MKAYDNNILAGALLIALPFCGVAQESGSGEISPAPAVPVIETGPTISGEQGVQGAADKSAKTVGEMFQLKREGVPSLTPEAPAAKEPSVEKVQPVAEAQMVSGEEVEAGSYDVPVLIFEEEPVEAGVASRMPLKLNAVAELRQDELKQQGQEFDEAVVVDETFQSAVESVGGVGGDVSRTSAESEAVESKDESESVEVEMAESAEVTEGAHSSSRASSSDGSAGVGAWGDGPGPVDHTQVKTWNDGYFPTSADTYYLGGWDYPRNSRGGGNLDPDLRAQIDTDLYQEAYSGYDFESVYPDGAFNDFLGVFVDHEAVLWEHPASYTEWSAFADVDLPILTREFEPDKAHVKAGPLYFDLLAIGAGVLYSDYDGVKRFRPGEEDGWLSFFELKMRGLIQITRDFYVGANANLVYLPGSNRVGFRLDNGFGPSGIARLNYQTRTKNWDILFYDDFRARAHGDFFDSGAIEHAGRYRFGFDDRYDGRGYLDNEALSFHNRIGIKGSRLMGPNWRLNTQVDRSDIWRTYDFVDHNTRHHAGALLGYEGSAIPFAPYLRYDVDTVDDFDTYHHRAYIGARGRLTENIKIHSRVGYHWTDGRPKDRENFLWTVGLTHNLSERTTHSVNFGQDFFIDDFTNDALISEYVRYNFRHRITSELYARFLAQISQDDYYYKSRIYSGDSHLYAATLDYRPLDYTRVTGGVARQTRDRDQARRDQDRMLYFVKLNQRLYSRTTIWFKYQFEETEVFDEHLYSTGIRKYF